MAPTVDTPFSLAVTLPALISLVLLTFLLFQGCFRTHLTHDLRGLSDAELKGLSTWTDLYAKSDKYFYVGKAILPEIDPESPIPEPC